jgi:hypothetical protein
MNLNRDLVRREAETAAIHPEKPAQIASGASGKALETLSASGQNVLLDGGSQVVLAVVAIK